MLPLSLIRVYWYQGTFQTDSPTVVIEEHCIKVYSDHVKIPIYFVVLLVMSPSPSMIQYSLGIVTFHLVYECVFKPVHF